MKSVYIFISPCQSVLPAWASIPGRALNPGASPQSRGEPSIPGRSNFLYAWESTLWGVALNPAWAFDLARLIA